MRKLATAGIAAAVLVASGCSTMTREDAGTGIGAVAGGVIGSQVGSGSGQVLATFVGAVLGALAGREIGRGLDQTDELHAQHVLEYNRTGERTVWTNPDTGGQVAVVPIETYQTRAGEYCREYQTTITVGGNTESAYGTACRQPDGTWKVMN